MSEIVKIEIEKPAQEANDETSAGVARVITEYVDPVIEATIEKILRLEFEEFPWQSVQTGETISDEAYRALSNDERAGFTPLQEE